MKIRYPQWTIALLSAALCGGSCHGKMMKPGDYFDSKPQLVLADAAAHGDIARIDGMIASGLDVNATGRGGMTAVLWALLHQNKAGFMRLLENGANPNIQLTETFDDVVTAGNSVVSFAAMHKDISYLRAVLKHGGNPNLVNPVNTLTPIYQSIRASRPENAMVLIAAGADLNYQNKNGETPVIAAATTSDYDLVFAMLEAGADPTIKNKWGYTVLYPIKKIRTDPKSPQYQWRQKVIDNLKTKGVDIESGK